MRMRVAILFLLTALGFGLFVTAAPPPAYACSCIDGADAERGADSIVIGTVTRVTDTKVRLAVESVERGSAVAGSELTLRSGRNESSCGYDFRTGVRYRVNSTDGRTGLCSGVRKLPAVAATTTTATATATAVVAAPPAAPEPEADRWWLGLIPGAALVLLAGAGVLRWRRRTD
jgi:hypothetical protein